MDVYFAVFNIQDKEIRKARDLFNKKFGKGSYRKYISRFYRNGIMTIFQEPPTDKTMWYVETVKTLVNNRISKEPTP